MTTGAAQTLIRSYGTLPGRRVLLAGNGPLNFQVGHELLRAGARVAAVADAARLISLRAGLRLGQAALQSPSLIAKGLALPAYERMLEASHLFNLLDARGAISVTERQRFILRVRTMARAWASA